MSDTVPAVAEPAAPPAIPETSGGVVGLDDFDQTDIIMPQLAIMGRQRPAVYRDNLSNEEFEEIEVVILGLVKGRVLWDTEVADDPTPPFCRSYNHNDGIVDQKNPGNFPWEASGFDRNEYQPDRDGDVAPLPCDSCSLKEFGSHPTRKNTPWCSEQFKLVVLMPVDGEFIAPAVLTMQRSAIKATRAYVSSFARAQKPLFVKTTKLSLKEMSRGQVDYAIPVIQAGEATDPANHAEWADQYRSIRDQLMTARIVEDFEEEATPVTVDATTTPAAASTSDDDMPF